jgi:hypothetical protein
MRGVSASDDAPCGGWENQMQPLVPRGLFTSIPTNGPIIETNNREEGDCYIPPSGPLGKSKLPFLL